MVIKIPKKTKDIYRGFIDQCPFDLKFTCWANNHNGRAKVKKFNKKRAKYREKKNWKREIEEDTN